MTDTTTSTTAAAANDATKTYGSGDTQVVAYLPMDDQVGETRKQLEEAIWHLGQIAPLGQLQYQIIADQNWMDSWKDRYQPLELGKNLIVLPSVEAF